MNNIRDYDTSHQIYLTQKHVYDNSNVVSRLVKAITGKKPKAPVAPRFAVKYSSIGMPFRRTIFHDGWSYRPDWREHYVDPIKDDSEDSIDDLWTVVEYEGNNIFTDLVTGQKFRISFKEGELKELMDLYDKNPRHDRDKKMHDLNERVQNKYIGYVEIPLAIGDERSLCTLTADIKESILEETVPQRNKITERLEKKEEIAREAIVSRYKDDVEKFDEKAKIIDRQLVEKEKERIAKEERERVAREEEKRREEFAKMAEEEKDRIISPRFDEVFGPGKKK